MTTYPMPMQVDLVKSCFMIHNFIRLNQGYDDEFDQWNIVNNDEVGNNVPDAENVHAAEILRDQMAQNMWNEYQLYIQNH